jgi:Tol biopolymer transport system component/DNA-binding winged helix-turn-helix (wHTH) protein
VTTEPPESRIIRFGDFELDLQTGELSQNGTRQLLPQQPFRILEALTRQPGELVTRGQMSRALWDDDVNVDFEHGVNAAIKRLRETLGDSAATPRFIETLPRRGYRFIAPVESIRPTLAVTDLVSMGPATRPSRHRNLLRATLIVLLLVAASALLTWRSTRNAPRPELVRLTSTSGLNQEPALSPDGTLVAYASDRAGEGSLDIWVQRVGGGEPIRITRSPDDEAEPSFSPDGTQIVFTRRETSGLFVVGSLGGDPRLVVQTPRARTPRFSPDGRSIAYWVGQPTFGRTAAGPVGTTASVFVVSAEGGEPHRIETGLVSARYPVWSPDGDRLLFLGGLERSDDWFLARVSGGAVVRTGAADVLRRSGVSGVAIPDVWTEPPAAGILFSIEGQDTSGVWRLPISPSGQIGGTPERLTFGTALERSATASRQGVLAFASIVENADIWRTAVDSTSGLATGALERVTDDVTTEQLMNVSADGRYVGYVSSQKNQVDAWVKDVQTGQKRQLTSTGAVTSFQISPNGSRVAMTTEASGAQAIEIFPTIGGPASMFCRDCGSIGAWSGDSTRLLTSKGKPAAVNVVGFSGELPKTIARHATWNLFRPHFSPDGRWVVFHTTNSTTLRQVYVVPATLADPVPFDRWIPIATDFGMQPSWSPDGNGIYYFSNRDGAFCLYLQPLDAATKRPAGEPRVARHFHDPRLRPVVATTATNDVQARYVYVNLTETTGNIWLLKNR